MTGFLGYEPQLVEALHDAMARALDELDGVRCSDVEAAAAMSVVASARSALRDTWLPFTCSLLACRALDGYVPASIDPGDLVNNWLRVTSADRGWRTATDPFGRDVLSAGAVPTADEVRALGAALSGAAGSQPMSAAETASIVTVLHQIAARPALRAVFLPALTTVGWTNVCNQLASTKHGLFVAAALEGHDMSADERLAGDVIDDVFAALGALVVADRSDHPDADSTLLLIDLSPLAAASLAQHLDLDAATLAATTRRIVEAEQLSFAHPDDARFGPRAADILFEAILATPGAPTAYVVLTADAPQLAMEATTDPDLAHRLVAIGTDPVAMTFEQATVVMPALVRWALGARDVLLSALYDPELVSTLVVLAAPHLLPLLTSGSGSYGMSAADRRAMEMAIMDDDDAFARLLAERDRVVAGVVEAADSPSNAPSLDDMASLLAIVDTMRRVRTVRRAEDLQAEWSLMWDLLADAVGFVPISTPWSVAAGAAVVVLRQILDSAGVGPDSVGTVQVRALHEYDTLTTVAAAAIVAATFDRMVADGRIPAGAILPPVPDLASDDVGSDYSDDFVDWLADSGFDPDVVHELSDNKNTIASPHESERNQNEALLGD